MSNKSHRSWIVVDDDFNRENNPMLIGASFAIPPSYCTVQSSEIAPQYENYMEWRKRNDR